jgi:branched-chain amino acid transport system ATP-binding protein
MSTLRLADVSTGYGKADMIRGVGFEIAAGQRVALVGSNGAGKSTVVKVINGLLPLRSGRIEWDGVPIGAMSASQRTRSGIATVPEGRLLFPACTVLENLTAAATFGEARARRSTSLDSVYDLFPRLRERSGQLVGTLSGGEQQMVAIGRALMTMPKLLILDEPSIGLAPKVVAEIFAVLDRLSGSGVALLLVEQNVQLSLRSVSHAHVLRQGEIVFSGAAGALLDHPEVRRAYLGD